MRLLIFMSVALVCICGCMTHKPSPTVSEMQAKRDEIEVLRREIEILLGNMKYWQQQPPAQLRRPYPLTEQAKDLDHAIKILKSAKERLGKDAWRIEKDIGGSF
jgi:hypothetical protein